jgi:glycosyltransferase involved in cell wall biosynthesis
MSAARPVMLFAANRGFALAESRIALIKAYLAAGWRVVLVTADDEHSRALVALGAALEPARFERGGLLPFLDLAAFLDLYRAFRKWRPAVAHLFHAKPMILGSRAGPMACGRELKLVCTVTGLGQAFVAGGITGRLARAAYATTARRFDAVVFQNPDDRQVFLDGGWVLPDRTHLIVGAGVDLHRFHPAPRAVDGRKVVLMVARLLRSKGVGEYIAAAGEVRKREPRAVFQLVGEADLRHPDAFPRSEIDAAVAAGTIEFLGYRRDVERCMQAADLFVFPSYYREGVPRVVIEAAACGLPVVAAEVPGTREAVRDGETGRLVPARDPEALGSAIAELLGDPAALARYGAAARGFVAREFDVVAISARHISLYQALGVGPEVQV